ncbi:MAG TPA: competence protein ComK [Bacillota bacterium]|nr:competence protein ComK [Bacillota bacterium]
MEKYQEISVDPAILSVFLQTGVAIEPVLVKDIGEVTHLILDDEHKIVHCTTQQFIRKLCQFLFHDFKALQNGVKEKLHKTQLLPIPLTYQFVLFPLRSLPIKNIKTRGFLWISYRKVTKAIASSTQNLQTEIYMKNGYRLVVPYTRSFVLQQLRDAQLVDYLFQEVHFTAQRLAVPALEATKASLPEQILYLAEAIRHYKP